MSDSIKVVIRMRPLIARETLKDAKTLWKVEDSKCVSSVSSEYDKFYFDRVFNHKEDNWKVYNEICLPIVQSIMQGFNGTVFAYGQTSSGKSFTMLGNDNELGIIQYAIEDIFTMIEEMPDREFLLRVSFLEIYNEKVFDLLSDKKDEDLSLQENIDGTVKVKDLKEEIVQTSDQIFNWMSKCLRKRRTGETYMNKDSSRSHFIFRMIIESRLKDEEDSIVNVSQLNLVDLAGSENAAQTKRPQQFKEGVNINLSLLMLKQVLKQLSDKGKSEKVKGFEKRRSEKGKIEKEEKFKANFRNSNLTRLLQNSLGGNALTAMICTATPASEKETLSTLKFAQDAKEVKNRPKKNEIINDQAMLKEFANKIKKLTKELEASKEQGKALEEKTKQNELLTKKIEDLKAKFVTQGVIRKIKANRRETWGGHLDARKFQVDLFPHKNTFLSHLPIVEEEPEVDTEADFFPTSLKQNRTSRSSGFASFNSTTSKKVLSIETQTDPEDPDPDFQDALSLVSELKNELLILRNEYEELYEYTTLEKQHLKAECELQTELEVLKNENSTLKKKLESYSLSDKILAPVSDKIPLEMNVETVITENETAEPSDKKFLYGIHNSSILHQFLENSLDSEKCMSHKKAKEISKSDLTNSTLLDESLQSNFMALYDECVESEAIASLTEEIKSLKYEIELKDKQISLFDDKMQIKEQMINSLKDEIALGQSKNLQTANDVPRIHEKIPQIDVTSQTDVIHSLRKNVFSNESQTSPAQMKNYTNNFCKKCNDLASEIANNYDSKSCLSTPQKSIIIHHSSEFSEEVKNISMSEEIKTDYGLKQKVADVYTEMTPLKCMIKELDMEDQTTQITPVKLTDFSAQCCRNQCDNHYVQTSPVKYLELFSQINQCSENVSEVCSQVCSDNSSNSIQKVNDKQFENCSDEMKIFIDKIKLLKSYTVELINSCLKVESLEDIDVFESEVEVYTSKSLDKEITALKNLISKLQISVKDKDEMCETLSNRLDSKIEDIISLSSKLSDAEEALNKKESEFCVLSKRISELHQNFATLTFICPLLTNIKSAEQLHSLKKSSDMVVPKQYCFPEVELSLLEDLALKLNSQVEQNALKLVNLIENLKKVEDELSVLKKENTNLLLLKNTQSYDETVVKQLKEEIETLKVTLSKLKNNNKSLMQKIADMEGINKDLQQKLANLEASHSEQIDALDLKFEESKFDWTKETERLIRNLEEKYEQELIDQQNKLSEEYSQKLYKAKEEHLDQLYGLKREMSEMKLTHSNEISIVKKNYENQIKDLEEQLFSENSEKETLKKQLENGKRTIQKKLEEVHNKYDKKVRQYRDINTQFEAKLRYYLEENERLKKENVLGDHECVAKHLKEKIDEISNEKDFLQKRYVEDINKRERIIDQLRNVVEKFKNVAEIKQNSCRNCKEIEQTNKKLLNDLDQRKAKIMSLEANNMSLVHEIKKMKELCSSKASAHCKCKTNPGDSETNTQEKNGHKNKRKSNLEQKTDVEGILEIPANKKESAGSENLKENEDPNIKTPNQENMYLIGGGSGPANIVKSYWLEGIIHKKDKEIKKLREELGNLNSELKKWKIPTVSTENKTERRVEMARSPMSPVPEVNEDITEQHNAKHPYPEGAIPKIQKKQFLKERSGRNDKPYQQQHAAMYTKKETAHDWKYPSEEIRYGSKDADYVNMLAEPECKQQ